MALKGMLEDMQQQWSHLSKRVVERRDLLERCLVEDSDLKVSCLINALYE